ncbi:MAG: DUF188 domain-containing protein [Treponema sp.]|nr:DUF188 domain-containing protein [Treponema sp.]
MLFSIWVDADSCPTDVRELIVRFIVRLKIPCNFVANRQIPLPQYSKKTNLITMIITDNSEGSADDFIVSNVEPNDLVITRDIPLAARLIEKKITTINDRGKLFTSESIREDLSIRNFNYQLFTMGIQLDKTNKFNKKNLNDFANCFDREIQKKIKQ